MKKVNLTKEQILEADKIAKDITELTEILGVTYGVLYARCKEYGISFKYRNKKWNIKEEDFLQLYEQGLNDREIGEILNIPGKRICDYRIKLGLPVVKRLEFELTPDQYQIFIGGMLGDSSMQIPKGSRNAKITFRHSLAQENYCLWKYEQLKDFCFKPYYIDEYDPRTLKTYKGVTILSKQNSYFTKFYDKFYKKNEFGKNIKYINDGILSSIEPLGLAIWFMDDGFKANGGGYYISTNCFTKEDINKIQNYFLYKYNIKTKIHCDNRLYISAKSSKTFVDLILPFMHPDCMYKLHSRYKTPLNEETPEKDNPVLNPLEMEENAERLEVTLTE